MLEESIMDKKSNIRTTQLQSKAPAVDCKKSDGTSTKPCPRQNKKREGNGATSKNEANRKNPTFQRGRGYDKRPRGRGGDGVWSGKEDTRLGDNEPELGSIFVQGSKKQSLNHLLNFQYAPRGSTTGGGVLARPTPRRHGLVHSAVHPHNRELFLQSNCQFVVRADGDYSVHMLEPDLPVKWDQIEQIIVRSPSELACPVCLHTPVAGRITRCGHVYCWPCALHYLALIDETPGVSRSHSCRPCPVCAQVMDAKSLKSVKAYTQVYSRVGMTMSMRLVRRLRGSTIVEPAPPRDGRRSSLTGPRLSSVSHQSEATQFAKLLTADLQEVKDILAKERNELTKQVQAEIDTSEICFIEEALHILKLREEELYASPNEVQKTDKIKATNDNPTNPINNVAQTDESPKDPINICGFNISEKNGEDTPELYQPVKALKAEEVFEDFSNGTVPHMEVKSVRMEVESVLNPAAESFVLTGVTTVEEDDVSPGIELNDDFITAIDEENQAKYFYFYQAADGQAAFLHSVNVRLLSASWGSLACAPLLIEGKLLRRESGSATTEVRRRMPCATHLPMHCPFDVVELELQPPDVTSQALDVFKEELVERARRRQKADREEKRREFRIKQQQEGQRQHAPNMSSLTQFPAAPHVHRQLLATSPDAAEAVGSEASSSTSKESVGGSTLGMSYTKVASSQGVWTVRAPKQAAPTTQPANRDNVGSDDEHVLHAPHYLNLSDAITAALLNTSLKGTTEVASTSGSGKKKKKKQKAKVLFATGIQPNI